jgi:hypothetical protein
MDLANMIFAAMGLGRRQITHFAQPAKTISAQRRPAISNGMSCHKFFVVPTKAETHNHSRLFWPLLRVVGPRFARHDPLPIRFWLMRAGAIAVRAASNLKISSRQTGLLLKRMRPLVPRAGAMRLHGK